MSTVRACHGESNHAVHHHVRVRATETMLLKPSLSASEGSSPCTVPVKARRGSFMVPCPHRRVFHGASVCSRQCTFPPTGGLFMVPCPHRRVVHGASVVLDSAPCTLPPTGGSFMVPCPHRRVVHGASVVLDSAPSPHRSIEISL